MDDAIRHKQLNISSRFSPRVAGENDFLQTVINKVIAAKEVNHKGQGTYCSFYTLVYVKTLIARFSTWDCYNHGVKGHNITNTVVWYQKLYLCCVSSPARLILLFLLSIFLPLLSALQTICPFSSVSLTGTSLYFCAENCFRKSAPVPHSCRCCLPCAEGRNSPFLPLLLLALQLRSQQLASHQASRGFLPSEPTLMPLQEEAAPMIPLVSSGLPLAMYLPAKK